MNLYELKQHAKKMSKAIYLAYPEKVADDVNTTVLALLEELQLLEHTLDASENHRVEIQQELDQLKQENQRLKDGISNALDFLENTSLHTEDEHCLHYIEMAQNWLIQTNCKGPTGKDVLDFVKSQDSSPEAK
jgi:uncharacterized protein YdcH (DUF465 family)